jgi:hypothetical protein
MRAVLFILWSYSMLALSLTESSEDDELEDLMNETSSGLFTTTATTSIRLSSIMVTQSATITSSLQRTHTFTTTLTTTTPSQHLLPELPVPDGVDLYAWAILVYVFGVTTLIFFCSTVILGSCLCIIVGQHASNKTKIDSSKLIAYSL